MRQRLLLCWNPPSPPQKKSPYKAALLWALKLGLQKNPSHLPKRAVWSSTCSPPRSKIPGISAASFLQRFWGGELSQVLGLGRCALPSANGPGSSSDPLWTGIRHCGGFRVGFWGVSEAHEGYLMQKTELTGGYGMGSGLDVCPQGAGWQAGWFREAEGGSWRVPSQG